MADDWMAQIAIVDQYDPIDTIVHIGAGFGAAAQAALGTGARRIVLVEPNEESAASLRLRFADDKRVVVLQTAVAESEGVASLNVMNDAGLTNVGDPNRLKHLFPGLRRVATTTVTTTSAAALLGDYVPRGAKCLLIIDALGAELTIVRDVISVGESIGKPNHILLRCAARAIFEDSAPAAELIALLQAGGYEAAWAGTDDPDFPVFRLSFNARALESLRLGDALAEAERELERLRLIEAEAAGQAQRAAELEAELASVQQALAKADGEARAAQSAQAEVGLALRLEMMREADLRDLQVSYAELLEKKQKQDALLYKLTQRLGDAAQYMDQLDNLPGQGQARSLGSDEMSDRPARTHEVTTHHKTTS